MRSGLLLALMAITAVALIVALRPLRLYPPDRVPANRKRLVVSLSFFFLILSIALAVTN